ncbi:hypothetical protein T492DRAFT_329385 [Pavlovales sp. CCMP2436]|nr:hypothetical protein T492DRAFT_329385 [Pavlovales sp. CCMP2436]
MGGMRPPCDAPVQDLRIAHDSIIAQDLKIPRSTKKGCACFLFKLLSQAMLQRTPMSPSGSNTTRALANARAPRIRRQTPTPSASVGPAFVRPAHYRRMPVRTPRTQPVPAGPAFVRPAHYRRMQDRMEMPARIECDPQVPRAGWTTRCSSVPYIGLHRTSPGFVGSSAVT